MRKRIAGNAVPERAYEQVTCGDGSRISNGLLLPYGVNGMYTALDKYVNGPAPNPALRERFEHDPAVGGNFAAAMRGKHTNTQICSSHCAQWRGNTGHTGVFRP